MLRRDCVVTMFIRKHKHEKRETSKHRTTYSEARARSLVYRVARGGTFTSTVREQYRHTNNDMYYVTLVISVHFT